MNLVFKLDNDRTYLVKNNPKIELKCKLHRIFPMLGALVPMSKWRMRLGKT